MQAEPLSSQVTQDIRVLIVEDNNEHANLMRHGLNFHEKTFEVEFVENIASARTALQQARPHILIGELDFADGRISDLLSAEPESEDYPIIVLTERGSERDAVDLLKAGVMDYIVKTRRKCQEIGDLVDESLKSWNRIRSIRQAEINLQQTLRLARSIMDSLPNPIGVLDQQGILLSVNSAWRSTDAAPWFGESIDINHDYLDFCENQSHELGTKLAAEIRQVIDAQEPGSAIHYQTKQEEPSWYSVTVHPCHGSGRAKAIVIHQDITDRKQLEVNRSEREIAEQQLDRLTPRERQVMDLVVGGKPNKSIARSLNISVKTVEMHRSNLMKKLKLRNVTDLVKLAVNAGAKKPDEATELV